MSATPRCVEAQTNFDAIPIDETHIKLTFVEDACLIVGRIAYMRKPMSKAKLTREQVQSLLAWAKGEDHD